MAGRKTKDPTEVEIKAAAVRGRANLVLRSGGNPQIAKADGDAPVQEYVSAMPGRKSDVGRRLDELIVRNVPAVRKAVRWNSPFYGIEGAGWFLSYHVFIFDRRLPFRRGIDRSIHRAVFRRRRKAIE